MIKVVDTVRKLTGYLSNGWVLWHNKEYELLESGNGYSLLQCKGLDYGDRLRKVREMYGASQKSVSDWGGLSLPYISKYEHNEYIALPAKKLLDGLVDYHTEKEKP